ncbi:MAG: hypothetical protein SPL79_00235 [Sphaerochaetaceae bacterium]|jgi:fatty acid desaturase|nr:hypothetical protein [Spirochaetaceae bacterium]MDY6342705.1 hypothetical protein [Sphaerochaetaceae bacterium]
MTKKQYTSLLVWTAILVVALCVGFALLLLVWHPKPLFLCVVLIAVGVVVAMLLHTLRLLRQDVDVAQSNKNPRNLQENT